MKPTTSLTLLLAFSFLFSCKKDNQSSSNTGNGVRPKTYTEDLRDPINGRTIVTYNLTYDASGRILGMVSIPAPPVLNFVYKYPNANTISFDLIENGAESVHEILMLNSFGLVDSTFQYNNTNDTTTEKHVYNSSHEETQVTQYSISGGVVSSSTTTNNTFDNNGNCITSIDDQGDTSVFDYYSLANTLNVGKPFVYLNKNLVKTQNYTSGGTTIVTTHYYFFDSQNRLIEDSAYVSGQDIIGIKSYTY